MPNKEATPLFGFTKNVHHNQPYETEAFYRL